MQSDLPWNISGIPAEAREAARAAARREGLSLGQWLTRRITVGASEETDVPQELREALQKLLMQSDRTGQNTAVLQAMIEALRAELEERQTAGPAGDSPEESDISVLARQMEAQLRQQQEFAEQMNAKIAVLANTLAQMSEGQSAAATSPTPAAFKEQIDHALTQTEGRISALSDSFVSLSGSMDLLRRDFREAMGELGSHLSDFDDRLQRMEENQARQADAARQVDAAPAAPPETAEAPETPETPETPHSFDLATPAPKPEAPPEAPTDSFSAARTHAGTMAEEARLSVPWHSDDLDDEEEEETDLRQRHILFFLRILLVIAVLIAAGAAFMAYHHIGFGELRAALTHQPTKDMPLTEEDAPHHSTADIQTLTKLAENGNSRAMALLGILYADGTDVPANAATARKWLIQASAAGEPVAQYRLGILYEGGHGLSAAPDKAAIQFSLAAKAGNLQAMYLLASAYATGTGVDRNAAEAAHWYRKAAGLGLADAAYNLAELYSRGDGVSTDLTEAYKWYAIAAAAGDGDATPRMAALTEKLSAAELTKAQEAAKSFVPEAVPEAANVAPDITSALAQAKN